MENALRKIGISIGTLLIFNTVIVLIFSTFSLSNILPAIIGSVILLYSLLYYKIKAFAKEGIAKNIHSFFKACLLFFIISFTVCTTVVYRNGHRIPPENADAVIVLGAGLRGEKVSLSLAYRLDAAIDYYNQNQNAVIVVSGGQGKNELVSEAFAMKTYLLEKGIPASKIITEDKSSRTVENFSFTKKILDEYFNDNHYETVYVTNSFHVFRAGLIAKQANLVSHGLSAKDVDFLQPTYYIREYFSIIKYFAIDYI